MTKEKTKFYLNEKLVEANADETIWQVANRLGTEIPHLCCLLYTSDAADDC